MKPGKSNSRFRPCWCDILLQCLVRKFIGIETAVAWKRMDFGLPWVETSETERNRVRNAVSNGVRQEHAQPPRNSSRTIIVKARRRRFAWMGKKLHDFQGPGEGIFTFKKFNGFQGTLRTVAGVH